MSTTEQIPSLKNNKLVFTAILLLASIGPIALNIILPAIPRLSKYFGEKDALLITTAALFSLALSQLFFGPMSDKWGRILSGRLAIFFFILGSEVCAFSEQISFLLFGRVLQFAGAAGCMVASRALITDFFPLKESIKVRSYGGIVTLATVAVAPLFGSLILKFTDWFALFHVMAIFGLLALVTTEFAFSKLESPRPQAAKGASLVKYFQGLARLFKTPDFIFLSISSGALQGGQAAFLTASAAVLVMELKVEAGLYPFYYSVPIMGLIGGNLLTSRMADRLDARRFISIALGLCIASSTALLILSLMGSLNPIVFVVFASLFNFGLGMTIPCSLSLLLDKFRERAGTAGAVFGVVQVSSGAMSSAIVIGLPFVSSINFSTTLFLIGMVALVTYAIDYSLLKKSRSLST